MNSRITYWNQGAERLYGWTSGEAVGKQVQELLFPANSQGSLADAARAADQKGEWSGELVQRARDGRSITVQARLTLIRDERDRPKSLLMINTDVTERKQLEEQFLRAQRLESLGVLVSGIAHDLNNALAPVIMGLHILRAQDLPPESDKLLQMIETSARRGADMVKQVLTFARGGESRKAMVNLDVLVREMSRIIADVFPRNIKCRVQSGPGPWQVAGIATQLHQVLMNLCVNARDAMPQGGTLSISLSHVHLDAARLAPHAPEAAPGNYVCLSVADTGAGIPQGLIEKVFEPFFTTKEPGRGTGLGLSTSRNIIRNHGGFITVHSEVGRGSVFRIYLPLPGPEAAGGLAAPPRQLPVGNGECVLVIDDEEVVLAIMRSTLENYGYTVLTAPGGAEAVACLAQRGSEVDVVITDLVMPFMDGHDTVMALRKIVPGIPVITVSGFGDSEAIDPGRIVDADAFIQKPFTAETLLHTLNEVLERKVRTRTGSLRKRTPASRRARNGRHQGR
ncbi:MAG TPA: response regulator [Verrucomicrobia bacterium]|nr:response regulator [Verrucomicrobiota bacterium]